MSRDMCEKKKSFTEQQKWFTDADPSIKNRVEDNPSTRLGQISFENFFTG
jgi:hypothetical protein